MVLEVLSEREYSVLPSRTVKASLLSNIQQPEGERWSQEDTKRVAYEQLTFPPPNCEVRNCKKPCYGRNNDFFVWYH